MISHLLLQNFKARCNSRNSWELVLMAEHITVEDLKGICRQDKIFEHVSKVIPNFPTPVEFHITEVTHVTDNIGLPKIWESKGFKGFKDLDEVPLLWWSLTVKEKNIEDAEERYLKSVFPDRTQQQIAEQPPFLKEFTTSLSFKNKTSFFGNFPFTFPLTEMIDAYKHQICGDYDPVLRVYQTKLYSRLIAYVVLIHRPQLNEKFKNYPELTSKSDPIAYESGKIIWKAQSICENHYIKMLLDHEKKLATNEPTNTLECYVWDNVRLAFHLEEDEIICFPKERLINSLTFCDMNKIKLTDHFCQTPEEAKEIFKRTCI